MSNRIEVIKQAPEVPRILVIYTGGTMGMVYSGTQLVVSDIHLMLKTLPELQRLPRAVDLLAWSTPLDSANMKPEHWQLMASQVAAHYTAYDGFVIIHGTDTMAWSAAALSFMLEGLGKPVVFTGAQLPMEELRSDARDNLINALCIAGEQVDGNPCVQEVAIFFDRFLWRGNRSRKVQSNHFDAFMSENYPALAEVGVSIEFHSSLLYRSNQPFKLCTQLETAVALLQVYPGISRAYVHAILSIPGLRGCVLETYGSGNMPTESWLLEEIKEATIGGVVFVNVSQCIGGLVKQGKYETSAALAGLGVVSGEDLTTEAAMVKLMFVLGHDTYAGEPATWLGKNIRGEMN